MSKHEQVQAYYGKTLSQSEDLQTNACCDPSSMPAFVKSALANIHDEVLAKYYGCGLTIPFELEGMRVLDLGCGAGRDVYALAQLVGENGYVVGVDMTEEQLAVARSHQEYHREKFGYTQSNVEFIKGNIEHLDELNLDDDSFDIIVSNCVINLATDKNAVLREAKRLLKQGGEMYFSDVYADRRVPAHLVDDEVLYGECLSGALYWNDFLNLAKQNGFADPRLVEDKPITINNPEIEEKVGDIRFYSATYRLFNIDELEPACEEYGQHVVYKGSLAESADTFLLDSHHAINKGEAFSVCGNTALMLEKSRFAKHFEFHGDMNEHQGIFEGCGTQMPFAEVESGCCAPAKPSGGCC